MDIGSLIGGTVSIIALSLLASLVAGFALDFGPPEYTALAGSARSSTTSRSGTGRCGAHDRRQRLAIQKGLIMSIPLVGLFVKILRVRATIFAPITVLSALVGVHPVDNDVFDIVLVIVFGALGYLMRALARRRADSRRTKDLV
ncbi:tripartite tricarboxylate transporter permease [Actinophytocola sp.]|uniref:tripartite tricarboxylate transporter permease n=1 Tax=Actinophytocola sp. TaxID=1872138 RepID=UPI0025BE5A2B|nr:tripartite tricarboxylate transporter permease [Actinophytocola sp.]